MTKPIPEPKRNLLIMTDIQLISFDLDDTLWPITPLFINAEQGVYEFLQQHAEKLTSQYDQQALRQARMKFWQQQILEHPDQRYQISNMRKLSLAYLLKLAGYNKDEAKTISELCFEHFMELRHQVEYFDHALATLARLSDKFSLAALSNGNSCTTRLGLAKHFQLHLSAEKLGVAKPEPEPFQQLLTHFDCPAAQAIHIGDHPKDDIWGAHNVGMHSIWFNPERQPWQRSEFSPSKIVSCLSEIPAAVDAIRKSI